MAEKIEISWKTIVFTVVFLLMLKIFWIIRDLLFALFLAFIFTSALKPIVLVLERKKIPRFVSIIGLFIVMILLLSGFFTFVVPPLLQETFAFFKNLPLLITKTFPGLNDYLNLESITAFLPDLTTNFVKVISGLFSNLIFVVSTIVFTFYFLSEEKIIKNLLDRFLEEKYAEQVVTVFHKVEQRMGAWLWGELILMIVIGLLSYIGLVLLKVKYAFALAIIAGLFEVAPIIGPTISAVPAFFVASSTSWFIGFAVIALYFLIQQLENNLIVPFVMKRAVGIHPIITLIALTIGGKLGGFLGILLSVPIALFIETLIIELYKSRR